MIGAQFYRELVSERRRGITAAGLRALLAAAEWPYAWTVSWRNRRYNQAKASIHQADVPVVSVGNLTLGGTGKTPMVRWIARQLAEQGRRVAILSRGYGSADGQPNDEALELALALPDIPHLQDPDRVASARLAVEEKGADVLLLDDGFQHRRLARRLDIVLLDALEPFGYGRVFPRGLLREPVCGLGRADAVVLSRANLVDAEVRRSIRESVQKLAPDAAWTEVAFLPRSLVSRHGARQPIDAVRGKRVAAFCGIGNPAGFRRTLDACQVDVVAWKEYPDHHGYSPKEIAALGHWAAASQASAVLCTMKDHVKLPAEQLGCLPLLAVEIEVEFLTGEKEIMDRIRAATARA